MAGKRHIPQSQRIPLQRWMDMLTTQRAGLRIYQWAWIILCVVVGLLVVAPGVLSQPEVYQTEAEARFDAVRYAGLYGHNAPGPDFQIAVKDATDALRQRFLAQRELRFGLPEFHVVYIPQTPGVVQVQATGSTALEAQQLANKAAEELVRQIQAAGGREILRNLLGWELVAAMRGEAVLSPFDYRLRAIIEHNAFPMSRPIEPVSARMQIGNLTREEQNDLARALEARYDLWTFEINTRNATLDAWCNTSGIVATAERERALQACAAGQSAMPYPSPGTQEAINREQFLRLVKQELEARERAVVRRQAINHTLRFMLDEQGARFMPEVIGAAYRTTAPLPTAPVPRYMGMMLLLTTLGSLIFGAFGVGIDRAAGVMDKVHELLNYHELIRDLVVRDLRVRYKGSVLGYIWTQLAPLMMMLVFTFVFTWLMPAGIALFPVYLIVGLLPWNYCSETISVGTRSVIDNANLIKKVFFPREILPLVSVLSSLLNYVLSLPMMFLVMAATQLLMIGQLNFSWTFLYFPVLLLMETLFLIGLTMFLSALAVFYRDVVHLMGILILFWFFLTPVFYSLENISIASLARIVRWLNPMASIIEFYREILYGNAVGIGMIPTPGLPALDSMLRVFVTVLLTLVLGYWFFQSQSGKFGELL